MLNLGKTSGDKRGLGFVDNVLTPYVHQTTFVKAIAPHPRKFIPVCHRNEIMTFVQYEKEPMYEAWERYKEFLLKCPHHELPKWMQVQSFYNWVRNTSKTLIDVAVGGALNDHNTG
ncbi:hypothetical protein CerSpe_161660 [Prunus speciosa]